MSWAHVSQEHKRFLADRAVEDSVAEDRQYQTITDVLDVNARGYQFKATQVPGLLIPLYNFNGERWGYQYRPDVPRQRRGPKNKADSRPKFNKYENPPGQEIHLDIPRGVRTIFKDKTQPLIVTEGPIKADAVVSAGYACVALLGVSMWRCPDWRDMGSLRGRRIYLAFDSDVITKQEVHVELVRLMKYLRGELGAFVDVCVLKEKRGEKVGIDDYLAAGGSLDDLLAAADDAAPEAVLHKPAGEERPELDVSSPAALRDNLAKQIGHGPLSGIFMRGEVLTRVPAIGEEGYIPNQDIDRDDWEPAQTRPIDSRTFRALVASTYWTFKRTERKGVPVLEHRLPDGTACDLVVAGAAENSSIPRLRGVVHTPIILHGGKILTEPGYDAASEMLYLPGNLDVPEIKRRPKPEDVVKALKFVESFIGTFPFKTEGDKANYYALLLTPFLRRVMPRDDVPFVAITAPQHGSGKSLLANIARIIHGGVLRSEIPGEDEEVRKVVTSVLYTTTGAIVQFDNVTRVVKSGHLDMLITGKGEWTDRPLGATQHISMVNDRVWVVTGNNIAISGDLSRRMMWITIDANIPKPWERKGFPDVLDDVRKERGAIVASLLTLVRAWASAGYPAGDVDNQSFPKWARLMSGILGVAGLSGFMSRETDVGAVGGIDDEDWEAFLAGTYGVFAERAFLARDLANECMRNQDLADTMPAELLMKMERGVAFSKSLGWWLRNRNGRWGDNFSVRRLDDKKLGTLWKIAKRD